MHLDRQSSAALSLHEERNRQSSSMSSMPTVKIFWSGGFDSSFRMVQLSRQKVAIQPCYVCVGRRSEQRELHAIASIREDIEKNPETKCTILPLVKKRLEDIPPDREITEAYKRLAQQYHIAYQYDWLARFCKAENIFEIELSVDKDDRGLSAFLEACGKLTAINEGCISYYVIDNAGSSQDLSLVFGRFRFPIPLYDTTKKQLVELYKEYGYGHVINRTWFCHCPIKGEPCGTCGPCRIAMEAGMQFRFSSSAVERYEKYRKRGKLRRWLELRLRWIELRLAFLLIRLRLINIVRRMSIKLRLINS